MSFTAKVKNEIISISRMKLEEISLLSAIVRNNTIEDKIKISTENASVAKYIYKLIKKMYDIPIKVAVRKGYNFKKSYIYMIEINTKKNIILKDLGIIENDRELLTPPNFIIDDDELIKSYLSGLFLSIGSVNDPKTSRYHLEFVTSDLEYANFISKLLNRYNLNSKVLKRENKYMIYIKESEKISDFLKLIKATKAMFYYEDIRIYRDNKNKANRLNNCEQANVDKIIGTANKQLMDIEFLDENGLLDLLDDKVKEVALYRMKYQEVSLLELSEIITKETGNKITKSGLHHRFKKIEKMANKVRQKQ